ncbi:PR domain zinc finger protein 14 [Schistosoma japonicum]|nr:PR domain zinc finger protein 14 [Schistosoma japonicum]
MNTQFVNPFDYLTKYPKSNNQSMKNYELAQIKEILNRKKNVQRLNIGQQIITIQQDLVQLTNGNKLWLTMSDLKSHLIKCEPTILQIIKQSKSEHYQVICSKPIPSSTLLGPFYVNECFPISDTHTTVVDSSILSTLESTTMLWMTLVRDVSTHKQQTIKVNTNAIQSNIIMISVIDDLKYNDNNNNNQISLNSNSQFMDTFNESNKHRLFYFKTLRFIHTGEELLLNSWNCDKDNLLKSFGKHYQKHKNVPFINASTKSAFSQCLVLVYSFQQKYLSHFTAREGYTCDRCGKMFAYQYYRDKHLKYTRCMDQGDRKYPCKLCSRSFEKRDRLRIHVLHVHEKHRPHKCHLCGKNFSQSSSLNKHLRVHSGERPYKCCYCNKAFTASSILRTHIRQHSGEKPFKCKFCWKPFASHAAHDSHVRRTHSLENKLIPQINKS